MTNVSSPSEVSPKQVTEDKDSLSRNGAGTADADPSVKPFDSHLRAKDKAAADIGDAKPKKSGSKTERALVSDWVACRPPEITKTRKVKEDHAEAEELCIAPGSVTFPFLPQLKPQSDTGQLAESASTAQSPGLQPLTPESAPRERAVYVESSIPHSYPQTKVTNESPIPSLGPRSADSRPSLPTVGEAAEGPASVVNWLQSALDPKSPNPIDLAARSTDTGTPLIEPKPNLRLPSEPTASITSPANGERAASDDQAIPPAKISSPQQSTPARAELVSQNFVSAPSTKPVPPLRARTGGTDAAKQQPRMSAAQTETSVELNPPATSQPDLTHVAAPRVLPLSSQRDLPSDDHTGHPDGFLPGGQVAQADSFSAKATNLDWQNAGSTQNAPASRDITHVFKAVTDTIERLHTDGQTRVEMKVRLPDGQDLTVRLQMQAGEVRTIFRTDSAQWREAITRGWSDMASNCEDRGLRLINPVFESPGTASGFGNLNQQSRQHRNQAETSNSEPALGLIPKKDLRTRVSSNSPIVPPSPSAPPRLGTAGLTAWA